LNLTKLNLMQLAASIDILEKRMAACPQTPLPLVHRFTQGMYVREIHMPKNTVVTSVVHLTEHPFVILKGVVSVKDVASGHVETIQGPHIGITQPGTRRLLFIHEDTIWVTFHATDKTDPDEIAESIADTSPNPLLSITELKNSAWRSENALEKLPCPTQ